jgi:PadR family transcriptional regulator, regulatory protein AphA
MLRNMVAKNNAPLSETSFALLGMLDLLGESSGYDLRRYVRQSIAFFWNASFAQIYELLRRLETMGLVCTERVQQQSRPDKVVYRITDAGRAALHGWLQGPVGRASYRDSFLLRVFFFQGLPEKRRRELVAAETRGHEERLAEYRAIAATVPDMPPFPMRTLRFGIALEELYLQWLADLGALVEARTSEEATAGSERQVSSDE